MSNIEWTNSTWNPVTGCDKVSPGCEHCYADRMAKRLQAMGVPKYRNGFDLTIHEDVLEAPLHWKKPRIIFVNSMSDLFHEKIPDDFLKKIFDVMTRADWHIFQVLTKRSKQLVRRGKLVEWPPNVWMGVTVESHHYQFRINDLRKTDAAVKWLSLEPLLGPLKNLDLNQIDWAVVGGESGPGARPMQEQWALDIKRACRESGTAFFFKQWGGINKRRTGRSLRGRIYSELPKVPELKGGQLKLAV